MKEKTPFFHRTEFQVWMVQDFFTVVLSAIVMLIVCAGYSVVERIDSIEIKETPAIRQSTARGVPVALTHRGEEK